MTKLDLSDPRDLARAVVVFDRCDDEVVSLLSQNEINRLRSIHCDEMVRLARAVLSSNFSQIVG